MKKALVFDEIARRHFLVVYVLFTLVIIGGFAHMQHLSAQLEDESIERTHVLCESQNELKNTITIIVDHLALRREDDTEIQFEARQQIREEVKPLLTPERCPPPLNGDLQ